MIWFMGTKACSSARRAPILTTVNASSSIFLYKKNLPNSAFTKWRYETTVDATKQIRKKEEKLKFPNFY